jgi:Bifunctional DNA primase/polymerase, N-terminal
VVVFDWDDLKSCHELHDIALAMEPVVSVTTASGKFHSYFSPCSDVDLPAKILWRGEKIGEIQRHEKQYVVAPPSRIKDGSYRWMVDPREAFPEVPKHLKNYVLLDAPAFLAHDDLRGVPTWDDWEGPPADVILRRALDQPGAQLRASGMVKFQCPACLAEGHDSHKDNAVVFADGRWGCAYAPRDPRHRPSGHPRRAASSVEAKCVAKECLVE